MRGVDYTRITVKARLIKVKLMYAIIGLSFMLFGIVLMIILIFRKYTDIITTAFSMI